MDELYDLMDQKHVFIKYHQQETVDITTAVNILIRRLVTRYNIINDRIFITKIIPGGSMVEQTRIWENQEYPMVEFDFLVLLQYRYEAQHVAYGCPGHLKVLNFQTCKGLGGQYQMTEEEFRPDAVVQEHNMTLRSILDNRCRGCSEASIECCRNESVIPCSTFRVDTESGWLELDELDEESKGFLKPVVMKWHSKVRSLIKPNISKKIDIVETNPSVIKVMADFVPGFQFSRLRIKEHFGSNFPNFPNGVQTPEHFYMVPKLCPKGHSTCWRISYCTCEVESMRATSQKHRDAYKMIKVFKNYALDNTILSTYFMKSVVLRHIDVCSQEGHMMQPCLIDMLEYTLKCFEEKTLPHFVLGHDLFENRVFFKNTKQEEVFLKNFQKLIDKLRTDKFRQKLSADVVKRGRSLRIKEVLQSIAKLLTHHREF